MNTTIDTLSALWNLIEDMDIFTCVEISGVLLTRSEVLQCIDELERAIRLGTAEVRAVQIPESEYAQVG